MGIGMEELKITNEEKAKEIYDRETDKGFHLGTHSLIEMAEWKDEQFKEYLEKRLSRATNIYERSDYDDYNGGYMDAISEIIKELFKEK